MSEPKFYDLEREVDKLLATGPYEEPVARFAQLTRDTALHQYALDRLDDPGWIEPLWARGFFSTPPQATRDEQRGTISFPPWPESRYLARMAARAPETVLEVVLQIPETENVRVHEDLAGAALALPADMAAKWAEKETQWVQQREKIYFRLPEKLGALIGHLAKGGQIKAALDLARSLLAVLPDPRAADKADEEETSLLSPEPRARFDTWDYEQILKKNIPDLVAAAGKDALTLLCDLLDSAVRLSRESEEDKGPEDYSYIWRPAIEDHEQNHPSYGLKDLLVSAVRDAAEQMGRADSSLVPALVAELENEKRPWLVFQRIALHLLRVCSTAALDLITERLTDRARFDKRSLWHEYMLLAREHFTQLSSEDQQRILEWIAAGPDRNQVQKTWEQSTGKHFSSDEIERSVQRWQLRRLAPLHDVLPSEWKQRYDRLVAELGKPEHPEFTSYSSGVWHGPTSPTSTEDLGSMSVEKIVVLLKTWQPSGDPMSPSPEGFGRALTAVVAAAPERFTVNAGQFQGLEPTYVRALLLGLRDAVKEQRAFSWCPVLDLCLWVGEQSPKMAERKGGHPDSDPDWSWTRGAMADLLYAGFEADSAMIPFDLRTLAWDVLRPLTDDPEPTLEYNAPAESLHLDLASLSINTTRGKAMHAVVRYALWVRQHIEKAQDGRERIVRGFDEMPEVRDVLNAHLDPKQDPVLAIRAVYGQWFPWLVFLDRQWTVAHILNIFPQDESLQDLRDAAWETYTIFCEPYGPVFEVLCEEYGRAVERIGTGGTERRRMANPEERLAEHLMILYRRGKLALDEPNGLLARFYAKASDALCGHAFSVEGRHLYKTQGIIPSEMLDRLKTLWEWRLAAAQAATPPTSHAAELAAFGWWFASAKFDDTWATTQLTKVLKIVGKLEGVDRLVVERLAALAAAMPRQAVECLRLIIEGDKEGWAILGWPEHAPRTILSIAIQSADAEAREAAVDLVHRLGARGHREFRDLLPKGSTS